MLNYIYGEAVYEIVGEVEGNKLVKKLDNDSRLMEFEGVLFFDTDIQDELINDYSEIKELFNDANDLLHFVRLEYQNGDEYIIGSLFIDEGYLEDMIEVYVGADDFEGEFLKNPRAAIDKAKAENFSYCTSELIAQVIREMNHKKIEVCDDIIKAALEENLVSQS